MEEILKAISYMAEGLLKSDSIEEKIPELLKVLGETLDVSRVYIFFNSCSEEGDILTNQAFEWVNEGVIPQIDNPDLQGVSYIKAGYSRWLETLSKGESILGNIRDFPEQERPPLEAQDIKSILVLPIFARKKWLGFIGFDECRKERKWEKEEIETLKSAAAIIGAAIERRRAYQRLSRINRLIKEMAGILELKDMLKKMLSDSLAILEAPYGAVLLREPRSIVVEELPGEEVFDKLVKIIPELKEPVFLEEMRTSKSLSSLEMEGIRSAVILPLKGNKVDGILAYLFSCRVSFDETDRELFRSFSEAVTQLISNLVLLHQLEDSERRYLTFLNAAKDAVFVHHRGTIHYVNRAAVEMLGYSSDVELIGKNFFEFIHPIYRKEAERRMERIYGEEKVFHLVDQKLLRKDGTPVDVEMTLVPFRLDREVYVHVVARDVTDKKRSESFKILLLKQFFDIQKQETLSLFTDSLTHVVKSVFTTMQGLIKLAQQSDDLEEISSYLSTMEDMLSRTEDYVRHILDYTLKLKPKKSKIDAGKLLDEASKGFLGLLPDNIKFSLQLNGELPSIEADYFQIQRMLLNLLMTARNCVKNNPDAEIVMKAEVAELTAEDVEKLSWKDLEAREGKYLRLAIEYEGKSLGQDFMTAVTAPLVAEKELNENLSVTVALKIIKELGGGFQLIEEGSRGFVVYLPLASGG